MATTVRETLALDSFKGFSVLAGFDGLDRGITNTTFIEAPDSWKWIRGGEFVITLAYAYQTEEQLHMLVKELIDRGATCIGIKIERFIKQIPQSVLDLAGPQMVVVVDIDNYKSQLTRSIAQGLGSAALENAKARIYSISRSFLSHLGGRKYPYAEMSDSVVYIFPAERNASGDRFRDLLRRTLSDMMKAVASETGFTVTVGIGDPCDNVFDCPESYRQAQQGLELLRQSTGGNVIARWEEMGVYKLLYRIVGTSEGRDFVKKHLGGLLKDGAHGDDVLLKTLMAVVSCNWNLKDSAEALDVHYNTLKYRWKKICSLLGIDPSKSGDRLNTMIALRLLRMEKICSDTRSGRFGERGRPKQRRSLLYFRNKNTV